MLYQLKDKFQLTDDDWNYFIHHFSRMDVPAKTAILHEGEIPSRIFFIEKGCLRIWFNHEGKDLTLQFFFENNVVASLESFKKGTPSELTIEAIEPCTLWYITRADIDKLMPDIDARPAIRTAFINFILERTFNYMKHFFSFIKDSPKQRYINLINDKPEIIKRVPQHYIASYLGITTVHLSRIKSQIAKARQV